MDVWTSFTDWLHTVTELVAWLPFVEEHIPAVDSKFTKQVSAGGGVVRTGHSSYQDPLLALANTVFLEDQALQEQREEILLVDADEEPQAPSKPVQDSLEASASSTPATPTPRSDAKDTETL